SASTIGGLTGISGLATLTLTPAAVTSSGTINVGMLVSSVAANSMPLTCTATLIVGVSGAVSTGFLTLISVGQTATVSGNIGGGGGLGLTSSSGSAAVLNCAGLVQLSGSLVLSRAQLNVAASVAVAGACNAVTASNLLAANGYGTDGYACM